MPAFEKIEKVHGCAKSSLKDSGMRCLELTGDLARCSSPRDVPVLTPPHKVCLGHSPLLFLLSASLTVRREYSNSKLFHSFSSK
jgi:hypothetical protein